VNPLLFYFLGMVVSGGGPPDTGGTGPTLFIAELVDAEWATAELYDDPEV
jgi:hypothetical protein